MKKTLIASLAATVAIAPFALSAQADDDFPSGPLTMMIGFNPGGSTDIQGRVLANVLEEELGEPVNVVNRPGAGSGVAFSELSRNTDGGHTFLFGGFTALTFSPIIADVDYEIDDFRYVGSAATAQQAIVTSPEQPFETWEELLEHGRENPMTYAQQTPLDQSIIQDIAEQEGLDLAIVPTGGGAGMAPLIPGQEVEFAYSGGTHAQYTPTGEMIMLAFMGSERSPFYPDTPTLLELGYDHAIDDMRSIIVPADTSDAVVARLEAALEAATQHPDFIEVAEDNTMFPVIFQSHEELEQRIREIRQVNEDLMAGADMDEIAD